jgi:hypothetical protein
LLVEGTAQYCQLAFGRRCHSFYAAGLISADLKIGQSPYSGTSPRKGEPILRGRSRGQTKASRLRKRNDPPGEGNSSCTFRICR